MKKKELLTVLLPLILLLIASCDIIGIENPFQLGEQTTVRKAPPENAPSYVNVTPYGYLGMKASWAPEPYAETYSLQWSKDSGVTWNTIPVLYGTSYIIPNAEVSQTETVICRVSAANSYGSTGFAPSPASQYNVTLQVNPPDLSRARSEGIINFSWAEVPGSTYTVTVQINGNPLADISSTTPSLTLSMANNNALYSAGGGGLSITNTAGNDIEISVVATNNNNPAESVSDNSQGTLVLGQGTTGDPFLVYHKNDLTQMGNGSYNNNNFQLMSDIVLEGTSSNWNPVDNFSGTLNGNNKSIRNLNTTIGLFQNLYGYVSNLDLYITNLSTTGGYCGGLAGVAREGATILGCSVYQTDPSTPLILSALNYNGGLVGYSYTNITNCHNNMDITSNSGIHLGGLVGFINYDLQDITVSGCSSRGSITGGTQSLGGLVGHINEGSNNFSVTLTDCSVTGSTLNGSSFTGGIAGEIVFGNYYLDTAVTITNCIFNGTLECQQKSGGIVGYLNGDISGSAYIVNCSSSGIINLKNTSLSFSSLGGLIGSLTTVNSTEITKCQSRMSIEIPVSSGGPSSNIGGLIGELNVESDEELIIDTCYSSGNLEIASNSCTNIGGLIGSANNESDMTIYRCFSSGNVITSGSNVGGFIGHQNNGSISSCYSSGRVQGMSIIAGFAGSQDGNIRNSFSSGKVTVTNNIAAGFTIYDGGTLENLLRYQNNSTHPSGGMTQNFSFYFVDIGIDPPMVNSSYASYQNPFQVNYFNPGDLNNQEVAPYNSWDFLNTWQMTTQGPILTAFTHAGGWPASMQEPAQDPVTWD